MTITGSCLCGAVHYEITGSLNGAGHCHCPMCRKWTGSAYGSWAFIHPKQFRWISGEHLVAQYESSPNHKRCFCRTCGSALVATHHGEVTEIVLGSVDGEPGVRPSGHIFVSCKAPWHEIADALPQYPEWPPDQKMDEQ